MSTVDFLLSRRFVAAATLATAGLAYAGWDAYKDGNSKVALAFGAVAASVAASARALRGGVHFYRQSVIDQACYELEQEAAWMRPGDEMIADIPFIGQVHMVMGKDNQIYRLDPQPVDDIIDGTDLVRVVPEPTARP